MLQITINNISNLGAICDYEVEVSAVGEWGAALLWRGQVVGHKRLDGWWTLLEKVAKTVKPQPELWQQKE